MTDYKNYIGFLGASPEEVRSKLRGGNGVQFTESLFEETSSNSQQATYSLREYPTSDKPSAYQIYMNSVDESEAALKIVGSLPHWRKLCSLKWFLTGRKDVGFEGLLQWRQDMWDRDKSAAKKVLMTLSSTGNVTAAKALDKMATEELARLNKLLPDSLKDGGFQRNGGKKGQTNNDDFDFLDTLGV